MNGGARGGGAFARLPLRHFRLQSRAGRRGEPLPAEEHHSPAEGARVHRLRTLDQSASLFSETSAQEEQRSGKQRKARARLPAHGCLSGDTRGAVDPGHGWTLTDRLRSY